MLACIQYACSLVKGCHTSDPAETACTLSCPTDSSCLFDVRKPLHFVYDAQGTAISAEEEFFEVYNLYVVQIPTHKPSIRIDHPPRVYLR